MNLLRLVLLAAVAPVCHLQGCDSTSNEPLPNSGQALCLTQFEQCIDPIFHTVNTSGGSCSQAGCHNLPGGAPAGGFGLNPGAGIPSPELVVNYTSTEARTLNNNLLLSKAALLNGTPHGGGQRLRQGDVCFNAIQEWQGTPAPADGSPCVPGNVAGSPFTFCINAALAATCGP